LGLKEIPVNPKKPSVSNFGALGMKFIGAASIRSGENFLKVIAEC